MDTWWPVDDAYHRSHGTDPREEIVIGAVLVQNTGWRHAERALGRLKAAGALGLRTVAAMPIDELRAIVRPAGFPRRKPVTLQDLARRLLDESGAGGLERLAAHVVDDPDPLRTVLLEVHGVGDETADAILAYAFDAPIVVVDAYMRRLMRRLGIQVPTARGWRDPLRAPYADVARWWSRGLPRDAAVLRRLHAAIVEHGKGPCRTAPACALCATHADPGAPPKTGFKPSPLRRS